MPGAVGGVLVGFGDGKDFGFAVQAADEGDAGGGTLVGEFVGHDHSGMQHCRWLQMISVSRRRNSDCPDFLDGVLVE